MTDIDILSAFVICGAASCVAAAMTALARSEEHHVAAALRICSAAFGVLGLSLVQLLFGVDGPMDLSMLVTLMGTSSGVALFAWGLARLSGERAPPAAVAALLIGVNVALLAAWSAGERPLSMTYTIVITTMSVLAVAAMRRTIRRPGSVAERILVVAMVGFAATWLARLGWTLGATGPVPVHHVQVPPGVAGAYGILYGVMPIFLATIMLSVVNDRLSRRLALRALTDELTGLMSRRALRELGPDTVGQARRTGREIAVLMVDLDHFKAINDRHGHLVGDDVLRQMADLLRSQLRSDALVTRFGGEEFAVLVPVVNVAAARRIAERLRVEIAGRGFGSAAQPLAVTASIGLSMLGEQESVDAALLRADEALYRAKHAGRDRVVASLEVASAA